MKHSAKVTDLTDLPFFFKCQKSLRSTFLISTTSDPSSTKKAYKIYAGLNKIELIRTISKFHRNLLEYLQTSK